MCSFILHSNFDPLTETYGLSFYTQYLARWPEYFQLAESPSGQIMGYSECKAFKQVRLVKIYFCLLATIVMGKVEGHMENWHGHVTALTVSPDYRRLGLAALLMNFLEDVSEKYVYFCPTLICLLYSFLNFF